jgi:CheY-like chemotaxis protein
MHILIVDDEDDLRERLCRTFDGSGHSVCEAANGKEAMTMLIRERIDLVITDVVMPEVDGLELVRYLKHDHKDVKAIVLSASDYSQDEIFLRMARVIGADHAARKSISAADLLRVVEALDGP